jgi:hypothetical protein
MLMLQLINSLVTQILDLLRMSSIIVDILVDLF